MKSIYIYEEDGYWWLTDQYDLNRVRFNSLEERTKWIMKYSKLTPFVVTIDGKPDVMANLRRG